MIEPLWLRALVTLGVGLAGLGVSFLIGWLLEAAGRGALGKRGLPRVVVATAEPVSTTEARREPQAGATAQPRTYERDELADAWAVIDRKLREVTRGEAEA